MVDVLGIDLGTTNSVMAIWDVASEESQLLPNGEGQRLTPSVVGFADGDLGMPARQTRLIGHAAFDIMKADPKRAIYSIKRFMGLTYRDQRVRSDLQQVAYEVDVVDEEKLLVCVGTERLTPVQVSAEILRKLKQDAEATLGRSISKAVITVPAYFNEVQRQATKEAGRLIGLEVARIINEPTAAALAYGLGKEREMVAVYDLGGGTFDISIVDIKEGLFRVKATKGDTHLGGDDFDREIVKWIVKRVAQEHGITLATDHDHILRSHLRHKAVQAKIALSQEERVTISLEDVVENETEAPITLVLSRHQLEELVDGLIEDTLRICDQALRIAKVSKSAISQVLLVGGQTRMPAIQAKLHSRYGWTVNDSINPDEVVASGAAVRGARICGYLSDRIKLLDVIPLTLGIEVKGGKIQPIIKAGQHIPTKSDPYSFTTDRDGQERIRFRVFQGERPIAARNDLIGEVIFDLAPPRPKREHRIECTFRVSAEATLTVRAKDANSNKPPVKKKFDRLYNLSIEEVEAFQRAAETHRQEDATTRQLLRLQEKVDRRREQTSPSAHDLIEQLDHVQRAIQARQVEEAQTLFDKIQEER